MDYSLLGNNVLKDHSQPAHHNPVKRRLVLEPGQWRWSSFRHYAYGERGPVVGK